MHHYATVPVSTIIYNTQTILTDMAIQWNNNQNVAWFGLLRGFFTSQCTVHCPSPTNNMNIMSERMKKKLKICINIDILVFEHK